jgi:DNA polymerase I-like protein with 3'-5' exonuclease and polymerase domains
MRPVEPGPKRVLLLLSSPMNVDIRQAYPEIFADGTLNENICIACLKENAADVLDAAKAREELEKALYRDYVETPIAPALQAVEAAFKTGKWPDVKRSVEVLLGTENREFYSDLERLYTNNKLGDRKLEKMISVIRREYGNRVPDLILAGGADAVNLLFSEEDKKRPAQLFTRFGTRAAIADKEVLKEKTASHIRMCANFIRRDLAIPLRKLSDPEEIRKYFAYLEKAGAFSYALSLNGEDPLKKDAEILGIGFYSKNQKSQIAIDGASLKVVLPEFRKLMEGASKKVSQNFMRDAYALQVKLGIRVRTHAHDACFAEYLLDSGRQQGMSLNDQVERHTEFAGHIMEEDADKMAQLPKKEIDKQAAEAACLTWKIAESQRNKSSKKMNSLQRSILLPAGEMLIQMRANGVCIDDRKLRKDIDAFVLILQEAESRWSAIARKYLPGETSPNIQADRQIHDILINHMHLPAFSHTKAEGRESVNAEFLMHYAEALRTPELRARFRLQFSRAAAEVLIKDLEVLNRSRKNPGTEEEKKKAAAIAAALKGFLEADNLAAAADTIKKSRLPNNYYFPIFDKARKAADLKLSEQELEDAGEICRQTLKFSQFAKVYSTYLVNITENLQPTDDPYRHTVHAEISLTTTRTGRTASREPLNLQNFPGVKAMRSVEDKLETLGYPFNPYPVVKDLVVSRFENGSVVEADFSQMEIRIMAALAGEKSIIEAYKNDPNADLHRMTARKVFEREPSEADRDKAKELNFGMIYGISDYGFAKRTGISAEEAGKYIQNYFKAYPAIKTFMEDIKSQLSGGNRMMETPLGRKRYLEDSMSFNGALREAYNFPIQGTASDIAMRCFASVQEALDRLGLKSKLMVTVHDSLVIDAHPSEKKLVCAILKDKLENVPKQFAFLGDMPMKAELKSGASWKQIEKIPEQELQSWMAENKEKLYPEKDCGPSLS